MTDLVQLESEILAQIAAAGDEAALEAVRVAALGKKGSISALLVDARQDVARRTQDARRGDQSRQGQGHAGADRAPRYPEIRRARRPARLRDHRRHAAVARNAGRTGPHPSAQPGDGRADRDLRRYGIFDRRRPGHRDRRLQFHQAEFPGRPSGPRDARHLLLQSEGGRLAHAVAHPYLAGAGAHHADPEAADPRSSARAAPTASIRTRPTRRSSTRSKASSSTRARISAT